MTMSVHDMLRTHPTTPFQDAETLARCIEECFACAQSCTACADACLGENQVSDLIRCIRLNLDCADVCVSTGNILTRRTAAEPRLTATMLQACIEACRLCGDECERHGEHHEHCRICTEACRRCEQACEDALSAFGA